MTLTPADLSVTRNPDGSWLVAAIVAGYRVRRIYYGHNKREAIRDFLDEINSRA